MCGPSLRREGRGIVELLIWKEKVTDGRTYDRPTCAKQHALSSSKGGIKTKSTSQQSVHCHEYNKNTMKVLVNGKDERTKKHHYHTCRFSTLCSLQYKWASMENQRSDTHQHTCSIKVCLSRFLDFGLSLT